MPTFMHTADPLLPPEWDALVRTVRAVGNSTVARRIISVSEPLGAGLQTVPTQRLVGITEGYKNKFGTVGEPIRSAKRDSGIVPIISKDFIVHWRDLAEARLTRQALPVAKAAAAAACCARSEDKLALFGHQPLGIAGLMTIEGRTTVTDLEWSKPGDAFRNFTLMTELLNRKGFGGPYAAVVHPQIFALMHRVIGGTSFLEIAHVRALLKAGIYHSPLLAPGTGIVISTGKQNFELMVSVDTSVAFLGARRMNLPFRVFKAIYLRILRRDAICTF